MEGCSSSDYEVMGRDANGRGGLVMSGKAMISDI